MSGLVYLFDVVWKCLKIDYKSASEQFKGQRRNDLNMH